MKKSFVLFLVFLLSVTFAYSQHLVQPDTLWTYGPAHFTSYPAVHPNGNVMVRVNSDLVELNGLTGKAIRSIYIPSNDYNDRIQISSDGTRMIAGDYLIDFETGELIKQIGAIYPASFLHPSNDVIIYLNPNAYQHIDSNLIIYNLMTGLKNYINTVDFPTALAVSNDGRYLAVGCWDYETDRTHFSLYDAQTLKLIDELEDVPSEGRRIEFIQFSENAKYVGYGHLGGTYKATIFMIDTPNKKWEFSNWKLPGYAMNGVGFIGDRFAFVSDCAYDTLHSIIYALDSDIIINNINNYGSYAALHNKINNSLILNGFYSNQYDQYIPILSCFDAKRLITGIYPIKESENSNELSVIYEKGSIMIDNLPISERTVIISIFNLEGKTIYTIPEIVTSNRSTLPLSLKDGVYILQITDQGDIYSQKFIISN